MNVLGKFIASVLVVMAVATIGVTVERVWWLSRSAAASRAFVEEVAPFLKSWDIRAVRKSAEAHSRSVMAKMFAAITRRYVRAHADPSGGGLTPVDLARNEAERVREAIGSDLRKGMNVLASVGSVAPFVGLLGTVVGIIGAFADISAKGSGGLEVVSGKISEALYETAFGLLVAIPAVLLFNYLSARVARVELVLARSAGELLDDMENHDGSHP
ncbi:MAG: MotA/TolQ/ExbB proton channel family protein [Myxococcota bacterium]